MMYCPNCNSEDFVILDEDFFASIHGRAEADASCECLECGCKFDIHAEGDFVIAPSDYKYKITFDPEEEGED